MWWHLSTLLCQSNIQMAVMSWVKGKKPMPDEIQLDLIHQYIWAMLGRTRLEAGILRALAQRPLDPYAEPKRKTLHLLADHLDAWNEAAEHLLNN